MDDIVFVSVYISDMNDWHRANKMYTQCIRHHLPPARALTATHLSSDMTVMMVVIAHKLISKTQKVMHHTISRDAIHVQSISHWAPANIGPYSQCVRVKSLAFLIFLSHHLDFSMILIFQIGEIIYVAGQIPLVPGSMELLNKPIFHQCRLTLRHVSRILKAADSGFSLSKVLLGHCFVTAEEIAVDIHEMWNYITKNFNAVIAVIVVSALPRNAQLEWQVVGCKFENPVCMYKNRIEIL